MNIMWSPWEGTDRTLAADGADVFSYENSSLDYVKKAVLYKNIIDNKGQDPKTYDSYRAAIEKYMVDQLMAGA